MPATKPRLHVNTKKKVPCLECDFCSSNDNDSIYKEDYTIESGKDIGSSGKGTNRSKKSKQRPHGLNLVKLNEDAHKKGN